MKTLEILKHEMLADADTRAGAGLSQSEVTQRMGTTQSGGGAMTTLFQVFRSAAEMGLPIKQAIREQIGR